MQKSIDEIKKILIDNDLGGLVVVFDKTKEDLTLVLPDWDDSDLVLFKLIKLKKLCFYYVNEVDVMMSRLITFKKRI